MAKPFLDVTSEVVSGGSRSPVRGVPSGLQENGLLYVDYTDLSGDTRVVEYRALDDRTAVDPATRRVVLAIDQPYSNHNGGQLAFGPDGRLWVGMGDGGVGRRSGNRAQDLSSLLGKLLTLDVSESSPDPEIAAYGLRNPWRFSFDRETGDLWIGDVGQGDFEEIDRLPRDEVGNLVNFGWDAFEGDATYEEKEPNPEGSLVGPVAVYDHGEGCSVTGGFVYRGGEVPALEGRYVYGDYCSGTIWSIAADGTRESVRKESIQVDRADVVRRGRPRRALRRVVKGNGLPDLSRVGSYGVRYQFVDCRWSSATRTVAVSSGSPGTYRAPAFSTSSGSSLALRPGSGAVIRFPARSSSQKRPGGRESARASSWSHTTRA